MDKKTRAKSNTVKGFNYMYVGIILAIIVMIATIILIKNNAPKDVELPNFVGMTVTQAEETAKRVGVKLDIDNKDNGTVIVNQKPKFLKDYIVKKGSTIKVIMGDD